MYIPVSFSSLPPLTLLVLTVSPPSGDPCAGVGVAGAVSRVAEYQPARPERGQHTHMSLPTPHQGPSHLPCHDTPASKDQCPHFREGSPGACEWRAGPLLGDEWQHALTTGLGPRGCPTIAPQLPPRNISDSHQS